MVGFFRFFYQTVSPPSTEITTTLSSSPVRESEENEEGTNWEYVVRDLPVRSVVLADAYVVYNHQSWVIHQYPNLSSSMKSDLTNTVRSLWQYIQCKDPHEKDKQALYLETALFYPITKQRKPIYHEIPGRQKNYYIEKAVDRPLVPAKNAEEGDDNERLLADRVGIDNKSWRTRPAYTPNKKQQTILKTPESFVSSREKKNNRDTPPKARRRMGARTNRLIGNQDEGGEDEEGFIRVWYFLDSKLHMNNMYVSDVPVTSDTAVGPRVVGAHIPSRPRWIYWNGTWMHPHVHREKNAFQRLQHYAREKAFPRLEQRNREALHFAHALYYPPYTHNVSVGPRGLAYYPYEVPPDDVPEGTLSPQMLLSSSTPLIMSWSDDDDDDDDDQDNHRTINDDDDDDDDNSPLGISHRLISNSSNPKRRLDYSSSSQVSFSPASIERQNDNENENEDQNRATFHTIGVLVSENEDEAMEEEEKDEKANRHTFSMHQHTNYEDQNEEEGEEKQLSRASQNTQKTVPYARTPPDDDDSYDQDMFMI
jgi:hypothetical protein